MTLEWIVESVDWIRVAQDSGNKPSDCIKARNFFTVWTGITFQEGVGFNISSLLTNKLRQLFPNSVAPNSVKGCSVLLVVPLSVPKNKTHLLWSAWLRYVSNIYIRWYIGRKRTFENGSDCFCYRTSRLRPEMEGEARPSFDSWLALSMVTSLQNNETTHTDLSYVILRRC